jgi:hypothetical protein
MSKRAVLLLVLALISTSFEVAAEAAFSSSAVAENTWATKAPMPTARGYLGVAVVNEKIYAIGGIVLVYQDASRTESREIGTNEEYDPTTNNWTSKTPMPIPSSHFATAVYNNKIYCIGGALNQVYNPATDSWENKTPMPIPKIPGQANVVNDKIYVFVSSCDGSPNSTLNEVYDPISDSWTLKASMPVGVDGVSAVYENRIYLIGSYFVGSSLDAKGHIIEPHSVPITQVYYPENDSWRSKGALGPSFGVKSVAITTFGINAPKKIYVFYNPYGWDVNSFMNQVYDPEKDTWISGASFSIGRMGFGVAVVNDLLCVIGGLSSTNPSMVSFNQDVITTYLSTVEEYTPFGYSTIPPQVTVTSPQNITYSASNVSLVFKVNKPATWIGYSLDGEETVSVMGNMTLSGLSSGLHNVTVYANDTFGNIGESETITFTVNKPESTSQPEPFPTLPVVAVSVAVVAVVAVGVLVCWKKRKH